MKKFILFALLLPVLSFAQTWEYVGGTDISHAEVKLYSITLAPDGTPYIFYNRIESDPDSTKLFVRKFVNNQWQTLPNAPFGIFHDYNCHNRIQVLDHQNVYVLFRQYTKNNASTCTRVMKFDGNQWQYMGDTLIMPEFASTNLHLLNQQPIIPYFENDSLRVLEYTSSWTQRAFPVNNTSGQTLLLSSDVQGNVIYFLLLNNGEYQIYSLEGANFQLIATIEHPLNDAIFFEVGHIRVNAQNDVFVHLYNLNTPHSYVFKASSGLTTMLGSGSLLDTKTGYSQLALDKNGLPVVAFRDQQYGNELSVMHYDGTNWNFIGHRGFTTNKRSDVQGVVVDQNNIPYVAVVKRVMFDGYVNILRLKQPISVESITPNWQLQIFPNPAQENIQVHIPASVKAEKITVYDVNGRIVYANTISENIHAVLLDVQAWKPGTYLVKVITNKEVFTQKFVKA